MITVSANIICKNEQDNIKQCIESVLPYVDEIVIVDTGSTDETIDIIRSLNSKKIKLLFKDWTDDFSEMRNYCIEQSKGDYILILDADMTVLNYDVKPELDYYTGDITVLNERGIVAFPMILLFKRKFRFFGKRHATIENDLKDAKGEHANIVYSHPELSKEEITEKLKRNLEIHLKEKDNPANIYHLFRTYYYFEDFDNAIKYGIDVLNSSLNKQVKALTSLFLYIIYLKKGLREIGIPYLNNSISLIPAQSIGRQLLFDLFCELDKGLAGETLDELRFFSKARKSDLPCDYFLNETEIKNLELKLKKL